LGKEITPNQKRGRCKRLVNKYTESTTLIPLSGANIKSHMIASLVDEGRQRGIAQRPPFALGLDAERIVGLNSGSIQGTLRYWIDPERNVRRMSGEQEVILRVAVNCSGLQWNYLFEAFRDCLPKMKV